MTKEMFFLLFASLCLLNVPTLVLGYSGETGVAPMNISISVITPTPGSGTDIGSLFPSGFNISMQRVNVSYPEELEIFVKPNTKTYVNITVENREDSNLIILVSTYLRMVNGQMFIIKPNESASIELEIFEMESCMVKNSQVVLYVKKGEITTRVDIPVIIYTPAERCTIDELKNVEPSEEEEEAQPAEEDQGVIIASVVTAVAVLAVAGFIVRKRIKVPLSRHKHLHRRK